MQTVKDIKQRTKERAWESGNCFKVTLKMNTHGSTPELVCEEKSAIAENQAAFLAMRMTFFPERYTA